MEEDGFFDFSDIMHAGIYALTWRGEVVYVGQSAKLFQRLYVHCSSRLRHRKVTMGKKTIKGSVFDGICILPCLESDLDRIEREMILKYQPRYNVVLKAGPKVRVVQEPKVIIPEEIQALIKALAPTLPPDRDTPTRTYMVRRL